MNRYKFCQNCGKKIEFNKNCDCKDSNKLKREYYQNNKEEHKFLNSKVWKNKRKYIIERDGHSCQRCLSKFGIINAKNLQVHHIKSRKDFPKLRLDDDNLITLCKTCNLQLGTTNRLDFETDANTKKYERDFNL